MVRAVAHAAHAASPRPARASAVSGHEVPTLMRAAYRRHAVKLASRATGAPLETCRNWWRRRASPNAETLLRWADNCDRFAAALEAHLHAARAARLARLDRAAPGGVAPMAGAQTQPILTPGD